MSDWEPAGEEFLGTKPKQWLWSPTGGRWLWKQSTMQRDRRHGEFRKGDDWSEVVASQLGRRLGVPVAEVRLASRCDDLGVISRSVLADENESLVHGNELLSEAGITTTRKDRLGYTLDAIAEVLGGVEPPAGTVEIGGGFEWFVGYLVLDALVGNTDRHQDNWAVIRRRAASRLSPSFDHASCLGFQISDDERKARLDEDRAGAGVRGYAAAARTKYEGRPHPCRVAAEGLARADARARDRWLSAIESCSGLDDIVDIATEERMTPVARRFARALVEENRRLLSHHLRTMGVWR